MCELFAMSSQYPATVNLSINTFAQHGGGSGIHKDGWGVVYYEGNDIRRIRDTAPAVNNEWIRFIEQHSLKSQIVISHIRKASSGPITLNNTQPFCRVLGGKVHTFAHNGDLFGLSESDALSCAYYKPLGSTDSEKAFCILMGQLSELWLRSDGAPSLHERVAVIHDLFRDFASHGPANIIYSDSEYIYAYSDKRSQDNDKIAPPGLYKLERRCEELHQNAQYSGLSISRHFQKAILLASVPLSNEDWRAIGQDGLLVLKRGREVASY